VVRTSQRLGYLKDAIFKNKNQAANISTTSFNKTIRWRIRSKEFESAQRTIGGIEVVGMIKNQMIGQDQSKFKTFCSLSG